MVIGSHHPFLPMMDAVKFLARRKIAKNFAYEDEFGNSRLPKSEFTEEEA
jgi:hypothetical protein